MVIINRRYVEAHPVEELEVHPENPRQGDVGAVSELIEKHGFYGALLVQESTGRVIAGNHRLLAARGLGITELPVVFVDVDDDEAKRILLSDNRSSDLATYDDPALAEILEDFATNSDLGLGGTGFDGDDLDALNRLLRSLGDEPTDPDAEWEGMPSFEQEDRNAAHSVTIHFPTIRDAEDFFALLERPRTRSLWWPNDDGHVGSDVSTAYVHDDEQ